MSNGSRVVVLSCLHTLVFHPPYPKTGEFVLCLRCDAYRRAATTPDDYRIECRDCTHVATKGSRTEFGGNTIAAATAADRHARRKPGHRVQVINGSTVVSERMCQAPASLLDEPPY